MKAQLQTHLTKLSGKAPRRLRQLLMVGALALLGQQQAVAQVSAYSFTQSSGTFTPITGGTVIIDGTSSTSLDSWTSTAITIPAVMVNQVQYTTAWITSNGLLKLGGTAPSTTLYAGNSTAPAGGGVHLAVFNADMDKATSTTASEIRWQTVGNEVVFQWKGWCRYGITENFDLQVRLNTVTGEVKYVYNLNSGPGTSTSYQPQVGMATSTTDFINRTVTTTTGQNWDNSIAGTVNTASCRFTGNSTDPRSFASGQTYSWTPPSCWIPSGTANSAVTTSGATVTWTATVPVPANGYEYYISTSSTAPTGSTTATGTTSTPSKVFSGLPASTQQYVWVRSACVGTDKSGWSASTTFTTLCVTPTPGATIASPNANVCMGVPLALSLTNSTTGPGISYLWQSSADGVTYTAITGATNPTLNTTVTVPYYRCRVICTGGPDTVYSTPVQLAFNSNILTTTNGQRCGYGTVTLGATATAGSTISWFNVATGGASLGTGTSYTTPAITATTNYYTASQTVAAGQATVGAGATTSATYPNPFYSLWSNTHNQYLITAAELQAAGLAAGNITSMGIRITSGTMTMQDFSVKMAHTTATNMSAFVAPTFTTVYTAASVTPVVGTNTMTFTTPFNWDGTSNIVIEVCHGNSGSSATMSSTAEVDNTSYVSTIHVHKSAASAGAATCADLTTNLTTYSIRPRFIFGGQALCESPRKLVTATINTAPAFDATNNKTVCNGAITPLTITTTQANYNVVTWSPVTDLYTDAAATVPYTAGTHAYTVYQKSTTPGLVTYISVGNNTTSQCGAIDTIKIQTLPAATTAIANNGVFCNSGTTTVVLNPAITQTGLQYQWQNSTDNITFTNIATSGTSATYTTPSLTGTRYYRATIKNSDGAVCFNSASDTVYIHTPQILTTTPATRCGIGTVALGATANAGSSINWYAAATGGSPIGSGTSFTTPTIAATTNFYVAAGIAYPITANGARIAPASTTNTTPSSYGLVFNALKDFTLNSIDVYNNGSAGTMVIQLQNSAGTPITTSATINVPAASGITPYTVALGWNIPAGTGYRILVTSGTASLVRESSLGGFPYAVGNAASITNGYISGTSTTYYYLYNWNYTALDTCFSARQQVAATVTPPPAFDITNDKTVCNNATTTLTVNSPAANFNTVTWSPITNLYTDAAATTAYTAGTNASTVYYKNATVGTAMVTANALNTTSQCANIDTVKIQTLPATATAVAAQDLICQSGTTTLNIVPAITQTGLSYQWQSSTDNVTFTDIATGGTGASYTSPAITATRYYRVTVKNSDGAVCFNSVKDTVTVNNPQILSTTPATRCGPGILTLAATANPTAQIKWYSAATGGTALGTGASFTTPSLAATTNYFVAAEMPGPGTATVGAGATTSTTYPNPFYSLWSNTHNQYLIPAAELQAAGLLPGNITSLAIKINSGTLAMQDFSIKMAHTTATNMSAYVSPAFTTVYTAATQTPVVGVNTMTFSTPFNWDGTSNVVIEICHGNSGSSATMSSSADVDNTAYVSTIHVHKSTSSAGAATCSDLTTNLTTYSIRPRFTFGGSLLSCASTRTQVTATVNPKPTAGLTPNGTINLCEGQSQVLTATGTGNYSWLKDNTLVPGQTNSTLTVNQTGGYKAVVTNTFNCADTSVVANVTVNPKPIVNLGNDTAVCANVPLTLNAGNPGAAYLWNDNSTNSTLTATASGQYRVKVTNSFNCATSDTINIAHLAVPVVNLGNDTMICNVQPLTLNAANPGAAYQWNTGATSQTISVNTAGIYSVNVTNANNCIGTDAISITVMPQPENDGFNFEPLFNEAMGKVRFEPINQAPNYTYAWDFGDGNTSTQTSPVHTYAAAGDYLVTMDVSNGCTDTSVTLMIKVDFTLGTVTVTKNNIDMKLYPNPAQDQLNLELVGDNIYFRNIALYNVIGQKVVEVHTSKTVTEKVNINQLPAGMYILKAETDKGTVMRKFEIIK